MLNKRLFAAKSGADQVNEAGGKAYGLDPRQALAQLALTGTLNDVFYADAESQLDQLLARCFDVSPQYVAKTAIYARQHGRMKDTPVVLLAWLASFGGEWCEAVFDRVCTALHAGHKAPRQVLQHLYAGRIHQDVAQRLVDTTLNVALQEKSVQPLSKPAIAPGELTPETAFSYKARFEVRPEQIGRAHV